MANRFTRLLEFANNQLGSQNAFTIQELMDLQVIHSNWVEGQYSINGILNKYGITQQQWDNIVDRASTWYAGSSLESDRINNEIKAHIKGIIGYLPAQVLDNRSLFASQLSSLFRKGTNGLIQRFKGHDGLYRYWI